jgi:hypothetical protein
VKKEGDCSNKETLTINTSTPSPNPSELPNATPSLSPTRTTTPPNSPTDQPTLKSGTKVGFWFTLGERNSLIRLSSPDSPALLLSVLLGEPFCSLGRAKSNLE